MKNGRNNGKEKKNERYSKTDFLKEIVRVFKLLDRPFTRREYDDVAKIHSRLIEKRFGSWNNALKESGLIEKFKNFLEVKQEIKEFNPQEKVKSEWKQEKEKLIEQAEKKKIAWIRNQENKSEILLEMITDAVSKAEPPTVFVHPKMKKPTQFSKEHCTLWLEFSDLQLGTCFSLEEMGGLNCYNWIIWQQKLTVWKEQVINLINFYKEAHHLDNVIIAFLGDLVEGVNIFKGQSWQVDRHVVDQAVFGANDTAAAFIEIFLTHPDITFQIMEVFGNHGRIGKKGELPYSCSMDRVFLRMVDLQIQATSVSNITWYRNSCWYWFTEIYDHKHLLLHGDQGMGGLWSGRPTINSLEKGLSRWMQMLQNNIHYIHIGHFHNSATWSFNFSQMLINGSFVGTSPFSATQMLAASPSEQIYHVLTPQSGLITTGHIYLDMEKFKNIQPDGV